MVFPLVNFFPKRASSVKKWQFLLAIGLACVFAGARSAPAQQSTTRPSVWMHPPGMEKGQAFRDLFEHPDQWKETRQHIDVLCSTDLKMNKDFSDDELRAWLPKLKEWNIHFALETGAVKPWALTGEKAFGIEKPMWERIERLGAPIYAIAMDEPLCCIRKEVNKSDDYAVRETANYIALVRKNFPNALVGDIEAYPFIPFADHITWIDALQQRLAAMKVRGLDFYRLDVNWAEFTVFDRGNWPEVRKIERFCRQHKIAFSLIYWASGYPGLAKRGLADDSTWYTMLMQQGYDYALVQGKPDHIVLESWIDAPSHCVPETDPWTFTRSVKEFCERFVDAKR